MSVCTMSGHLANGAQWVAEFGASGGSRTHTGRARRILSAVRLPVPPRSHGICSLPETRYPAARDTYRTRDALMNRRRHPEKKRIRSRHHVRAPAVRRPAPWRRKQTGKTRRGGRCAHALTWYRLVGIALKIRAILPLLPVRRRGWPCAGYSGLPNPGSGCLLWNTEPCPTANEYAHQMLGRLLGRAARIAVR